MCFTGAARATQALVSAELAQHERRMGDERALVTMSEAIDALERAGNLGAAAVARRDLGSWRLADGDPAGVDDLGVRSRRSCGPTARPPDRAGRDRRDGRRHEAEQASGWGGGT